MENVIIDRILKYDDAWLPMLALIICLIVKRKTGQSETMIIIFLAFSVVFSLITDLLADRRINNLVFYHFYTLFEQWYLSCYIIQKITKGKVPKIYYYFNSGFTLFWIVNILFLEPYDAFNTNTSVASSLIIVVMCMYYMLELSKHDEILYFQRLPAFWIISGFLLYNALGILIFAVYRYYTIQYSLNSLDVPEVDYWIMMHFPIVLKYTMIIIGILCYGSVQVPKQKRPVIL